MQTPKRTFAHRLGEFIGFSISALIFLLIFGLALLPFVHIARLFGWIP